MPWTAIGAIGGLGMGFMGLSNQRSAAIDSAIIDEKNFRLQQQWFDYQKALQKKLFEREDTAYQRKVADLQKAGINPMLAAGGAGAGAGSPVSTDAPQKGQSAQERRAEHAHQMMNMMQQSTQLSHMKFQNDLLREEIQSKKLDNIFKDLENKAFDRRLQWEENVDIRESASNLRQHDENIRRGNLHPLEMAQAQADINYRHSMTEERYQTIDDKRAGRSEPGIVGAIIALMSRGGSAIADSITKADTELIKKIEQRALATRRQNESLTLARYRVALETQGIKSSILGAYRHMLSQDDWKKIINENF